MYPCVSVWSWTLEKWGGIGPQGAVEPLKKNSKANYYWCFYFLFWSSDWWRQLFQTATDSVWMSVCFKCIWLSAVHWLDALFSLHNPLLLSQSKEDVSYLKTCLSVGHDWEDDNRVLFCTRWPWFVSLIQNPRFQNRASRLSCLNHTILTLHSISLL
jgi:hypothetical protein